MILTWQGHEHTQFFLGGGSWKNIKEISYIGGKIREVRRKIIKVKCIFSLDKEVAAPELSPSVRWVYGYRGKDSRLVDMLLLLLMLHKLWFCCCCCLYSVSWRCLRIWFQAFVRSTSTGAKTGVGVDVAVVIVDVVVAGICGFVVVWGFKSECSLGRDSMLVLMLMYLLLILVFGCWCLRIWFVRSTPRVQGVLM